MFILCFEAARVRNNPYADVNPIVEYAVGYQRRMYGIPATNNTPDGPTNTPGGANNTPDGSNNTQYNTPPVAHNMLYTQPVVTNDEQTLPYQTVSNGMAIEIPTPVRNNTVQQVGNGPWSEVESDIDGHSSDSSASEILTISNMPLFARSPPSLD